MELLPRDILEDIYFGDFTETPREWATAWSQGKRVFVIENQRLSVDYTLACWKKVVEEGWDERFLFFTQGPHSLPVVTAAALFDLEECHSPVTGERLYFHIAADGGNWDKIPKVYWYRYAFGKLLGLVPDMSDVEAVEWAYVKSSASYLAVERAYRSLWNGEATHAVWEAFMEAQKRVFPRGQWEKPDEPAQQPASVAFKMPTATLYQDLAGFAAMDLQSQINALMQVLIGLNKARQYNWDNVSLIVAIDDVSVMIAQRKVYQLFGLMPTVNALAQSPNNLNDLNQWLKNNARRIATSGSLQQKQEAANLWFEVLTGTKILAAVTNL